MVADLTKDEGISAVCKFVKTIIGVRGLYGLVNNAGLALPGNVDWAKPPTYEATMALNFFAPVKLVYELLPSIKRAKGRVVNVTSVDGFISLATNAAYCSSKHALESYSDVLRCEMKPWGVDVIVIQPATMRTPLAMAFADAWGSSFKGADSERRAGYGEEWASKVTEAMKKGVDDIAQPPGLTVSALLSALTLVTPPTRTTTGTAAWLVFKPLSKLNDRMRDTVLYAMSFGSAGKPIALSHPRAPKGVVSHITIKVSDLSKSITWYENFGFTLIAQTSSSQALLKGGEHKKWQPLLLLSSSSEPLKRPESWSAGMQRLCIYAKDFEGTVKRLKERGLEPYVPIAGKTEQIAAYKDPDGFVVYLIVFRFPLGPLVDASRLWYGAKYPMMFHLSINVADTFDIAKSSYSAVGFSKLLYEVGRDKHQVRGGEERSAYCHLLTTHLPARSSQKNLLPAFGLSETETHIDGVRMCQLPSDVFSITLLKWTSPETKREGGEALNSLSISVDDVDEALEKARAKGFNKIESQKLTKLPLFGEALVGAVFIDGVKIEYIKFLD